MIRVLDDAADKFLINLGNNRGRFSAAAGRATSPISSIATMTYLSPTIPLPPTITAITATSTNPPINFAPNFILSNRLASCYLFIFNSLYK